MENYELYKWFIQQGPVMQALYAGLFTWGLTALGAALVFLFNSSNRKILDAALGFTGGVMIAASFWSLLSPSISYVEMQNEMGLSTMPVWLPPAIGFFLGALFLYILDKTIPHLHLFAKKEEAEGIETDWKKTILLVLAIALHNIPEGLAVGVAFGALANPELLGMDGHTVFTIGGAIALAIGIGIKNFPEIIQIENLGEKYHTNAHWHSDVTFEEKPPNATLLYSLEVPDEGGDTLFSNQYLAYESLPESIKESLYNKLPGKLPFAYFLAKWKKI